MRFLKLIPAGDPGVNHVKMETDTPESISLPKKYRCEEIVK